MEQSEVWFRFFFLYYSVLPWLAYISFEKTFWENF
ncbi:hypothetical protein SLEP1_g37792 [Rubroshorea leprosula]|uniref:Uncharacterized protein n=1 Tax=Rubroshorea leprosula TaxID=152421 RepID=A0AAV5KW30_9ROSI|nr:hypothetical protein SLEP1_g37792 [Rubroshorea leprosula]